MAVVVIWVQRRTRARIILALAAFALLGIHAGASRLGEVLPAGVELLPITRADTTRPVAALTFEIAQGTGALPAVLEVLRRHQVTATFFVNGSWALHHPDWVRKLVQAGHELALGGHWVERLVALPSDRIAESIRASQLAIEEAAGASPSPLFRPPGGYSNSRLVETALNEGYHTVLWSLDARDAVTRNAERTAARVAARVRPGDIVRFSADALGHPVASALELAITRLTARGFRLVSVGMLLRLEAQ